MAETGEPVGFRYGGLHLRLAAALVDLLAVQAVYFLVVLVRGMWSGMLDVPLPRRENAVWWNVGITWLYFVVFECSVRCATPGKMLFRLAVTDSSRRRITFTRSAFRFLFKLVSAASLVGVLAIPFDRRRRGLHDVLAGTLVVERSAVEASGSAGDGGAVERIRSRPRLLRVLPLAAAAVVVVGLAAWQYSAWDQERIAQTACLRAAQTDVAKAKAARNKWSQFQDEAARLETDLEKVRRMLPPRLEVDAFRRALDEALSARGIRSRVSSVQAFRRGRLFRAELTIEAAGDPTAISGVLGRTCCGGRLTSWRGSFTPEGVRGALSIFATPAAAEPPSACPPRRGDLWLWPFTARADRLAAEVGRARADLSGLSRESDGVRRYEILKEDLETRILFVNRIVQPGGPRGRAGEPDEPEVPVEPEQPVVRS
jgi:uncharacterized RDD family membrane protein YckC